MARIKKGKPVNQLHSVHQTASPAKLRIIGGKYRGRQIRYSGDPQTRPMKDNVREAIFNLIGGWTADKYALDLFAGTGALGLEALSRGARHALFIERHIQAARIIRENIASLGADSETTVITSDTFFWFRQQVKEPVSWPKIPWIVFCSPPYRLYQESRQPLLEMLDQLISISPESSVFSVESDQSFPPSALPHPELWKVRTYSPAQLCVFRK